MPVNDDGIEYYIEAVRCPECRHGQLAQVLHTVPFDTWIHDCEACGYTIMESDWEKVE